MPKMNPPAAQPSRPVMIRRPPYLPIWAICSGSSTPVAVNPSKLRSAGCSTSENSPKSAASSVQPSHTTTNTNHWYPVIARQLPLRTVAATVLSAIVFLPRCRTLLPPYQLKGDISPNSHLLCGLTLGGHNTQQRLQFSPV